jgi:hypothetical protein
LPVEQQPRLLEEAAVEHGRVSHFPARAFSITRIVRRDAVASASALAALTQPAGDNPQTLSLSRFPMSACFTTVANRLYHPSLEPSGVDSLVKGLLEYAAANNSGGDVITNNAASECLRRFMQAGVNENALTVIRERLSRVELNFAEGK